MMNTLHNAPVNTTFRGGIVYYSCFRPGEKNGKTRQKGTYFNGFCLDKGLLLYMGKTPFFLRLANILACQLHQKAILHAWGFTFRVGQNFEIVSDDPIKRIQSQVEARPSTAIRHY